MGKELDVVVSDEYTRVRNVAYTLSEQMPQEHMCRKGNGACCEARGLAIVADDAKIILQGIQDGSISPATVSTAIENSRDEGNTYCPFFDRGKRVCTIYTHRPVQCISYGMSATPLPTSEYHAAVLNRKYTKRDRGVSLYSCDHIKLCETCVVVNTLIGMRMPLQVLEDSPQVTDYLTEQEDFSINTFVDKLPPLLANVRKK